MVLRKYFIASALLFSASSISLQASDAITPEMRKNAEAAIQSCENTYQNTKQLRSKFDKVKKPGPFSSKKTKDAYKNLTVNKKAFDIQFSEFTRFTNEKINIRTAKSISELRDKVAAYSSNCSRFAAGIAGFVEWATTGEGPTGYATIYQDWQNDARKQM